MTKKNIIKILLFPIIYLVSSIIIDLSLEIVCHTSGISSSSVTTNIGGVEAFKDLSDSRGTNCRSKLNLITNSIEMYNIMDAKKESDLISGFNDNNEFIEKIIYLKEKKYISNDIIDSIKKLNKEGCNYVSQGNLADDSGKIYCQYHGNPSKGIKESYKYKNYLNSLEREKKLRVLKYFIPRLIIAIVITILI